MSSIIYHIHHITPKHVWKKLYGSLDGVDAETNLAKLTVKEHAEIHYERWIMCGDWQDLCAWKALSKQITQAEAKLLANIEYHKNNHPSDATKEIWQKQRKGKGNPMYGRKRPEVGVNNQILKTKEYIFIDPYGKTYYNKGFREFCRNHKLLKSGMLSVLKRRRNHYKQWKCYYYDITQPKGYIDIPNKPHGGIGRKRPDVALRNKQPRIHI